MKQKLNKIKLFLFIFMAIAFFSCEKDLYEDAISNNKTIIREVKFNELYKEQKFKNLLEKIGKNKTTSKNFFEDNEEFILSSQNVKIIETDSIISYTILIKRKNNTDNSYFENLVIQKDILNNESAFIFKYVPDEIRTDVAHNSFSFTGKVIKSKYQIKSFNKSSFSREAQSGCTVDILMCYESWSGGAGHSHTATSECNNIQYLYVRTVEVLCADSGGGGGGGGGGDTAPPPSPGGGGGGGGGNTPDTGYIPPTNNPNPQPDPTQPGLVDADGNILTSPVMPVPSALNTFEENLNPDRVNWWRDYTNVDKVNSIKDYLNNNTIHDNINQEVSGFAESLIDMSMMLDMNAASVWGDYDNFIGQMSTNERAIFTSLLPNRKLWYMCSAKKAFDNANELFPSSVHNGIGDAYRHALWNGYSSLLLGRDLTEQLTTAHEEKSSTYSFNYKENEMDMYNNNKGRLISITSPLSEISNAILLDLQRGYLRYLNNLSPNGLATSNSILIPTDQ